MEGSRHARHKGSTDLDVYAFISSIILCLALVSTTRSLVTLLPLPKCDGISEPLTPNTKTNKASPRSPQGFPTIIVGLV